MHSAKAGVEASHFTTLRLRVCISELRSIEEAEWLVDQFGHGYANVVLDLTAAPGNPSSRNGRQRGSPNREQEKISVGQRNLEALEQVANQECSRDAEKNVAHASAAAVSCDLAGGPAGQHHKR